MFEIQFTTEARSDIKALRRGDQVSVMAAVESQLTRDANRPTRNRKKLRPNPIANWELRVGEFRVFYNVDAHARVVSVEAIGFKIGNVLFIRNERQSL